MLYNKSLNSLAALRAERLALKKQEASKNKIPQQRNIVNTDTSFITDKISQASKSLMGNSKFTPLVNTIVQIALPILAQQIASKTTKKLIFKAASKVIFGYVKWQVISSAARHGYNYIKEKRNSEKTIK